MVNNHGDCKSPKDGVVGPFQMAFPWLINGGDPDHLLSGMILQVEFERTDHTSPFLLSLAGDD